MELLPTCIIKYIIDNFLKTDDKIAVRAVCKRFKAMIRKPRHYLIAFGLDEYVRVNRVRCLNFDTSGLMAFVPIINAVFKKTSFKKINRKFYHINSFIAQKVTYSNGPVNEYFCACKKMVFKNCNIFGIPNGVEHLVFKDCMNTQIIELPDSVKTLYVSNSDFGLENLIYDIRLEKVYLDPPNCDEHYLRGIEVHLKKLGIKYEYVF
jgi:hypothetical protein